MYRSEGFKDAPLAAPESAEGQQCSPGPALMNGAVLLLSWQRREKKQHQIRSCDIDSGNHFY